MKVKVTEKGVVIPKDILIGADEVDIQIEENRIILILLSQADPILDFGTNPVKCEAHDASENHDKYLYGSRL